MGKIIKHCFLSWGRFYTNFCNLEVHLFVTFYDYLRVLTLIKVFKLLTISLREEYVEPFGKNNDELIL